MALTKTHSRMSLEGFAGIGDDVADDAAAFQTAATAAAGSAMLVPKGTYKLNTKITLPAAGLTIEGQGFDSVLKVGSANQTILEMVTGGWLRLHNIRLVGDNTTSNIGVWTIDTGDIDIDTVWFDNFGSVEIGLNAITGAPPTERARVRVRNITCTDSHSANAAAEEAHISMRGNFRDILIDGVFGEAAATTPKNNGVFVSESAADEHWERCVIRDVHLSGGHGKRGIVINNETAVSTFESGKCVVDSVFIQDTTQSALKTKNVDRLMMSNIYAQDCDATPEVAGNLQGTIFVNGAEDFTGTSIEVRNCGTDGIRFQGRTVGTAAGLGRAKKTLTNFICDTADETGILIGHNTRDMIVNAPQCYDCGQVNGSGIRIITTTAQDPPEDIIINSPKIRRTGTNQQGINIGGLSGEQVGRVIINSPNVAECGTFGLIADFVDYLQINGGIFFDNGQDTANPGLRLATVDEFSLNGVRSTNIAGVTQNYGITFSGAAGPGIIDGCDFDGNNLGPFLSLPDTVYVGKNKGMWQPSVTFTSADATPSVSGREVFGTAGTTTITDFDDGEDGQTIYVKANGSITVQHSASILLDGAVNFAMVANNTLSLTRFGGTWIEVGRKT